MKHLKSCKPNFRENEVIKMVLFCFVFSAGLSPYLNLGVDEIFKQVYSTVYCVS